MGGIPNAGAHDIGDIDGIYRRHSEGIRRYVLRVFGAGPPDPEDVVQAAFERYALLDDREAIENPSAFLKRSARNYVIDQRRRQTVRATYSQTIIAIGEETDDFDAERVLSAKERWAILERAIRSLDHRRQEMLIMNRIHGISFAEIARRKQCSPTLVKMLVAEALVICHRAVRMAEEDI